MIKTLMGNRYITVTGGASNPTYINHSPTAQGVGNMRFNTALQQTEVFDGVNWLTVHTTNATVGLSHDAERAIEWAHKKVQEEERLHVLMEQHPGLKDLHEKFNVMLALIQKEDKVNAN